VRKYHIRGSGTVARRRRKKQASPLEAIIGFMVLGAFLLGFKSTQSLTAGVFSGLAVLAVFFMVMLIIRQARMEKLRRSGIAEVDKMSGREFEHYLGQLFKAHGYSVDVTKSAGDFGADLVIAKEGRRIIVQAKRYSKNVGIKAVQEAFGAIMHYKATEAWVVSNSGYTAAAITLAKSNNVRLIDRNQLIELALKMNTDFVSRPKSIAK